MQSSAAGAARVRWGMLGTARIGRKIAEALQQSERGVLEAVASRDADRAAAYARAHGIPRWFGDYDELLSDPALDAVYIPLPNHLHAEWTLRALEAGKHVLCEKPFALRVEDVEHMFATARRVRRALSEAFMYRHHPKLQAVKDMIDGGALGQVRLVQASFSFNLNRPDDVRWDAAMGGGSLWDVGCYCVSLAQFLFGGTPERVAGWQMRAPSGVDEFFAGTLTFPGGRVAQFDCSFRAPFRERAEVVGTQGVLTLVRPFRADEERSEVRHRTLDGDEERVLELPSPERYLLEIEDMHDAILTGKPPRIPPEETRGVVETVLRLLSAAA